MEKHWVEEIFKKSGAVKIGHFVLSSRRHSGIYLDKRLVYTNPEFVSDLGYEMACQIRSAYPQDKIEVVVGPAYGGIKLAHEVAGHLQAFYQKEVVSLFAEKNKDGEPFLTNDYQKLTIARDILVVDDILSTGQTLKKLIREVRKPGGKVVAVVVICNRSLILKEISGSPLYWLWRVKFEDWPEKECPLCKDGKIPIDPEVGRGREFLEKIKT